MSQVIYLSNVRLSFPHIAEPQKKVNEVTGATRISYNCELLMPEEHGGFAQFMARFAELALEVGKENAPALMQMIDSDRKSRCFGKGSEKVNKKTFVPYDGYAGNMYITAARDIHPQVIQADGKPIDPSNTMAYMEMARKLYGGCRVNAAIKPWWQKPNPAKGYGHGIRCDLVAIQFLVDDTAFGEAPVDASGMFGSVAQSVPAATPAPVMPAAPFAVPSFMAAK